MQVVSYLQSNVVRRKLTQCYFDSSTPDTSSFTKYQDGFALKSFEIIIRDCMRRHACCRVIVGRESFDSNLSP